MSQLPPGAAGGTSTNAWAPGRLAARLPHLRRRALMAAGLRAFFTARGYAEVETPYGVPAPGEEVHIPAFAITPGGNYLHTSPEFAMKKLLAGGAGPIFQLARVWRDEPPSATHAAEFTMLEFYLPDAGMDRLMDETTALLQAIMPPAVTWGGATCGLETFERLTVAEAFTHFAGIDILAMADDAPGLAAAAGTALRARETFEDLFFRLLLERIEPRIGRGHPTFLTHWPAAQAALARLDAADPRIAARFELYACGLELGNGFVELTDAATQRRRFEADRARRHALHGPDWEIDEDFLTAVSHLPDCAGIAIGFDRLVMLATGAPRISDVLWLPS